MRRRLQLGGPGAGIRPRRARLLGVARVTPPALLAGVRAIFGYPLQVGSTPASAPSTSTTTTPERCASDQLAEAVTLAATVTRKVLDFQAGVDPGVLASRARRCRHAPRACRTRRRGCCRPATTSGSARPSCDCARVFAVGTTDQRRCPRCGRAAVEHHMNSITLIAVTHDLGDGTRWGCVMTDCDLTA